MSTPLTFTMTPAAAVPYLIVLSDRDISQRSAHHDWDMLQSVTVLNGAMELVLTWRMFFILPDAVVAQVMPPDDLRTMNAQWRNVA